MCGSTYTKSLHNCIFSLTYGLLLGWRKQWLLQAILGRARDIPQSWTALGRPPPLKFLLKDGRIVLHANT